MFLKLNEQRCIVVGAGKTAEEKIPTLLACGARVIVVAPSATPKIKTWARTEKLVWMQRPFEPQDLNDALLCVVATSSKPVNRAVFQEHNSTVFCATWFTTGRTAISTILRWSAVDRSRLPSRPLATAAHSRNGFDRNWNISLARSGKPGCAGWARPVPLFMRTRCRPGSGALSCTNSQARRSRRVLPPLGSGLSRNEVGKRKRERRA